MERAGVVAGLHPLGERRDLLLTLRPDGELCAAFVRCVAFGRLYSYSYSYTLGLDPPQLRASRVGTV